MNKALLYRVLNRRAQIQDAQELDVFIEQYPYFSVPYLLKADTTHEQNDIYDAALRLYDRSRLKKRLADSRLHALKTEEDIFASVQKQQPAQPLDSFYPQTKEKTNESDTTEASAIGLEVPSNIIKEAEVEPAITQEVTDKKHLASNSAVAEANAESSLLNEETSNLAHSELEANVTALPQNTDGSETAKVSEAELTLTDEHKKENSEKILSDEEHAALELNVIKAKLLDYDDDPDHEDDHKELVEVAHEVYDKDRDEHGHWLDSDGDGIPDHLDKDAELDENADIDHADDHSELVEAAHDTHDKDKEEHGHWQDSDGDGIPDHLDKEAELDENADIDHADDHSELVEAAHDTHDKDKDEHGHWQDSDGDGIPDHLDKEAELDENADIDHADDHSELVEAAHDTHDKDKDEHGHWQDSDGDGIPDHLDKEAGLDENADIDHEEDYNELIYSHTNLRDSDKEQHGHWQDSDGDGIPDHLDKEAELDENADIDHADDHSELLEATHDTHDKDKEQHGHWQDSDGDGIPDHLDKDAGLDENADIDHEEDYNELIYSHTNLRDSDKEQHGHWQDSDGDGIPDHLDKDAELDENADIDHTDDHRELVEIRHEDHDKDKEEHGHWQDSDGDGIPDHLDKEAELDESADIDHADDHRELVEIRHEDHDKDKEEHGHWQDSDGDGIPDHLDKDAELDESADIDHADDHRELVVASHAIFDTDKNEFGHWQDSDGDGIPDYLDKDSLSAPVAKTDLLDYELPSLLHVPAPIGKKNSRYHYSFFDEAAHLLKSNSSSIIDETAIYLRPIKKQAPAPPTKLDEKESFFDDKHDTAED